MDKVRALLDLRDQIVDAGRAEGREAWFFPDYQGVKGYLGTMPIVFAGPNPSTGHFPQKSDKFLYDNLQSFGFAEAHLTDCIKYRATNNEILALKKATSFKCDEGLMLGQRAYFLREIEIIRPSILVAMGNTAAEILAGWLQDDPRLVKMLHYKKPARFNQIADHNRFVEDLNHIRKVFGSPGGCY